MGGKTAAKLALLGAVGAGVLTTAVLNGTDLLPSLATTTSPTSTITPSPTAPVPTTSPTATPTKHGLTASDLAGLTPGGGDVLVERPKPRR